MKIQMVLFCLLFSVVAFGRESKVFVKVNVEQALQQFHLIDGEHEVHGIEAAQDIQVQYQITGQNHLSVLNQTQTASFQKPPGLFDDGFSKITLYKVPGTNQWTTKMSAEHVSLERDVTVKLPFGVDPELGKVVRRQKFEGKFKLVPHDASRPGNLILAPESNKAEMNAMSEFLLDIMKAKVQQICDDPYVKAVYVRCLSVEMRRVQPTDPKDFSKIKLDGRKLTYKMRPMTMEAMVNVYTPW